MAFREDWPFQMFLNVRWLMCRFLVVIIEFKSLLLAGFRGLLVQVPLHLGSSLIAHVFNLAYLLLHLVAFISFVIVPLLTAS